MTDQLVLRLPTSLMRFGWFCRGCVTGTRSNQRTGKWWVQHFSSLCHSPMQRAQRGGWLVQCMAERHGLVCGMKRGSAETFPSSVAGPVCPCAGCGAKLEMQPFAFCVWGALSALCLHLHSFSQTSLWLCTHPASSKDRNLHFSLHFWGAEILESLNHLACPLLCCLCCIPFM